MTMRMPLAGPSALSPARNQLLASVMIVLFGLTSLPDPAAAQAKFSEEGGTLPDGTVYLMRVPANWNKTVLRDLDYASGANNPRYQTLLEKGYAVSGTMRHRLRMYQYDPAREIVNLNTVLDRFEARFGKPSRVIQFGCSGGGHVALAVAENFSDRIDGSIALAAHTPVWIMNTFLDGWFALKALIAPELAITSLPSDQSPITAAWRQAIDAAQKTPEGRDRKSVV